MSLYKNSLILSQPGQYGCSLDIFGDDASHSHFYVGVVYCRDNLQTVSMGFCSPLLNQNSTSVALYPGWDASSAPPP